MSNVEARVKEILVRTLELEISAGDIGLQDVIFEGELEADSVASLEIITNLEDEFGILFADDEIGTEMFSSVASLVGSVQAKLG